MKKLNLSDVADFNRNIILKFIGILISLIILSILIYLNFIEEKVFVLGMYILTTFIYFGFAYLDDDIGEDIVILEGHYSKTTKLFKVSMNFFITILYLIFSVITWLKTLINITTIPAVIFAIHGVCFILNSAVIVNIILYIFGFVKYYKTYKNWKEINRREKNEKGN